MKKFLLCMMLAGLMMPVVAQEKMAFEQVKKERTLHVAELADFGASTHTMLPMNPKGTLVDVGGWKYAGTSDVYDRQSQGSVYPQTKIHSDGFIGCTWTNDDNPVFPGAPDTPNRGVAYTYSKDGGATWATPDTRIAGIPIYWPSYAQWGPNGEAILARSYYTYNYTYEGEIINILDGLILLTRENKGEGKWTLTPLPYPEGHAPSASCVMAWARMTTSGEQHQYIHIMSPMQVGGSGGSYPVYYYKTQDGKTWDVEAKIIADVVGHEWDKDGDGYNDGINFAVQGNTVACCFISMGSDGYVLKSEDNGTTWKSIKFFDSPVRMSLTPADYADTVYAPVQGCVALDNNGKMHLAFSVVMVLNSETTVGYFSGFLTSFLSYWNEDMEPIDGAEDFVLNKIDLLWDEYFDWDQSEAGRFYVNSTVPEMPVIGFYTPLSDANIIEIDADIVQEWVGGSYWYAGGFSFPQMEFDITDNTLHLVYLGLLDGGEQDGRWLRHPFYTTTADGGTTWTKTEYLVNTIDLIDREFAYLTLAGVHDGNMYLMAQVDPYAGVYIGDNDHAQTINYYYYFYIKGVGSINEVSHTPLTMQVMPNPASGQATVTFEGKGNITVYNMLGQAVYHVENVENTKTIPLNDMASGVYFVTVRSGNATATQKLIVQ